MSEEEQESSAARQPSADLQNVDYEVLRKIARAQLRRCPSGATLNTTAVVHEAYLRLCGQHGNGWREREHFYAAAARAMRHLLIDHARQRATQKHGGQALRVTLREHRVAHPSAGADVLMLDNALSELGRRDPSLEHVVECRFFAGMTAAETAATLNRSVRSVERDWARARAYLYRALSG